MKTEYPVVIVGAGPAGAIASLFLSNEKITHLIIDKGVFPRDKICGDAVSGKMLEIIAKIKPDEVREFAKNNEATLLTFGIQFVAPNGKSVDIAFPKPKGDLPVGFLSTRLKFDNFLFNLLPSEYADIERGIELKDICYVEGGVELKLIQGDNEFSVKTPLVIAADGSRSVVKKKLMGEDMDEKHFCGGLRAYYKGITGIHPENYLEMHFFKDILPGYFWIFPLPGGYANVGMGMLSADISKNKVNLRKELLNIIENQPSIKGRFENAALDGKILGWGLPLGSKKRKVSSNHVILTGDAGSFIDPFTGEGIGNAGVSGMVASRIAKKAIEQNNFSAAFLKEYDTIMYQKLWNELKLSHRLQRLTTFPWLFNFVVNRIHASKSLQQIFTGMFNDLELRAKMKNPLFYLRLLFNK